jgi:hypothetical protein
MEMEIIPGAGDSINRDFVAEIYPRSNDYSEIMN